MAHKDQVRAHQWRYSSALTGALGVVGCLYSLGYWIGPLLAFSRCFLSTEIDAGCVGALSLDASESVPPASMYLSLVTTAVSLYLMLCAPWLWRFARYPDSEPERVSTVSVKRVTVVILAHHFAIWIVLLLLGAFAPTLWQWVTSPASVPAIDALSWLAAILAGFYAIYRTRIYPCAIKRAGGVGRSVVYIVER